MLKISNKASLNISIVLAVVFFVACIIGLFVMPTLVELLINLPDNIGNRDSITETGRMIVHILAYLLIFVFILADVLAFCILHRVKKGLVFTIKSVSLIRGLSWSCVLMCFVCLGLGVYFQLAFIVAFLAVFLGLCMRVVKNVIEQATLIKSENDLTI